MRAIAFTVLALVALSCSQPQLSSAEGEVAFNRKSQHLGDVWVGLATAAKVPVQNRGRSPLPVRWEVPEGFFIEALPDTLPSGQTDLLVHFVSAEPGLFKGTLEVIADKSADIINLSALVLDLPACNPPTTCSQWTFDIHRGECVETKEVDGVPCDPASACVLDATCEQGQCVGAPRECSDGNACTLDTCNAVTGCEFPPAPPCPGDGRCGVGVCHPMLGCRLEPAVDGTVCGATACDEAEVCIGGACVVRDPPDGFLCAEPTPCRGAGTCQGSTCVLPAPTPLAPEWSFNEDLPGAPPRMLHDFVIEADGRMAMTGFGSQTETRPEINAGTSMPQTLFDRTARRCVVWNQKLTCVDFQQFDVPGEEAYGALAVLNPDGRPQWSFRLATARPAFRQQNDSFFMARIAVMGPDRIAGIWEAHPSDAGGQCRNYYLAILDAAGGLVSAHKLSDSFLSQCNHPHPYGVVADAQENLYISFSPSAVGGAPLAAQSPSFVMSYDRNGTFRWKRVAPYPGGELGVVGNLLFSEGAEVPLLTSNGAELTPVGGPREAVGRPVATLDRYVSSPRFTFAGATLLHGYTHATERIWTYQLGLPGETFLTRELRMASWHPRAEAQRREVVLTFARLNQQESLLAIDPAQGEELWRCPVNARVMEAPQRFEIANDRIAVMGDALTLGVGDPPFAGSRASFWRFHTPGIYPSLSPWPGTWGGPGHEHRERAVATTPSAR